VNKYRAKKVVSDGITFDSLAEHRRYQELKLIERAGEIRDLKVHPRYPLVVFAHGVTNTGTKICDYVADFEYVAVSPAPARNVLGVVTEDVKGMRSGPAWTVFRIKAKLFEALMGRPVEVYPLTLLKPRRRR
jgi:hypothetical protein